LANRGRLVDKTQSWQAPSFLASSQEKMGWVEEACVQEGESWIKGQKAYTDVPRALQIVAGTIGDDANQKRSTLNINHAKFDLRKIIGTLADVREVGQYRSDVKHFANQAAMFNKVVRAVALEAEFPWKLRMALQYMGATAKGYIWPKFERMNGEEGGLVFEPLGLLDVLPVQLPSDNDIQKAYTVTIIVFMPVWMAHGKFPWAQESLKPIARRRYTSSVSARRLDLAERFKYGDSAGENWANLYCEIRYTFVRDLSMNPFPDKEIPMGDFDAGGEPKTSWSYKVPYLNQQIPKIGPGGRPTMQAAEPEDCMIYPYRRLIISSKGMNIPLYDGPAKDWSARVPLAEYCADDWPWEPCGFSLTHDIYSMERSRQAIERGVDQVLKARLDPSLGYDRSAGLNDVTAQTIDPFEERGRVGVDGEIRKVIDTLLPEWLLEVPAAAEQFIKYLKDSEDAQLGLNEIQNLAEFKATLQSEQSLDKALSLVGPLVKDIGSGMERSTGQVWELMKFMIPQYYTAKRIMQYVGPDGITPETFDYDPDKIVPSHAIEEFYAMPENQVIAQDSKFSLAYRGRQFAKNLRLVKIPHTLHEITQTQEQMKWMMLYRSGFPVAPHDVAKKLNIDNFGEIEGDTYFDRWLNYKLLELELQARMAALAQSLAPGLGAGPGSTVGTGPKGGQKTTGGRAPSGGQAPKLKQKSGGPTGPRIVQSESG
jgi:hypothetical protein